jgi:hypothetical protein
MHFFHLFVITLFIYEVYIYNNTELHTFCVGCLIAGLFYPFMYDTI